MVNTWDSEGEIAWVNVYAEPTSSAKPSRWRTTVAAVRKANSIRLIVAGDLNAKNRSWGAGEDDARGTLIVDDCAAEGLLLANDPTAGPTFVGPMGNGWVDVTLYRGCDLSDWTVHPEESLSDHAYISFRVRANGMHKCGSRAIYNFDRADWQKISDSVARWEPGACGSVGELNEAAENLQTNTSEACKEHIPRKIVSSDGPRWWNAEIAASRSDVRKARKDFQRATDPVARVELGGVWREQRLAYKKLIKQAKQMCLEEQISDLCENESWSRVWEALRRLGAGRGETGIWREDATYANSQDAIDEELLKRYHPVCDGADMAELLEWQKHTKTASRGVAAPAITEQEILDTVKSLKNGKACGRDAIPNEALKFTVSDSANKLAYLYTRCLELGHFPAVWKVAKVVWLPKPKGGYRPISLLPAYGKILDKILDSRLKDWLEKSNALSDNQHGFREGRHTIGAIQSLISKIKNRPAGMHVMLVLLDLSNAFNMAWPPQVLHQLRRAHTPPYLQTIVASFMSDRQVYSGRMRMKAERGCPQGSSMGPTLWLVAMQGWFEAVKNLGSHIDVQAYADDQCVLIQGTSVKKIESAWRAAWERCNAWEQQAKMHYNIPKTEMLFIPAGKKVRPPVIYLGQSRVDAKDTVQYLGITLDARLNFYGHIEEVRARANKLAPRLRALLRSRADCTKDTAKTLYKRVVLPGLLYGAEIWGDWKSGN